MERVATQPIEEMPEHSSVAYFTEYVSVVVVGYSLDAVNAFNK